MVIEEGEFYITDRVHRAFAARELRLTPVPASLMEPGKRPRLILIDPAQLHSPKLEISRFYKNRDFRRLLELMSKAEGRSKIRPVEVQRLGSPGQTGSIPLEDVQFIDEEDPDD